MTGLGVKCVDVLSFLVVLWAGTRLTADDRTGAGGNSVEGLRISIRQATGGKEKAAAPGFAVLLENVGANDLNLRLGYSLANGTTHHPAAVALIVTGPDGKARQLAYKSGRVAGRMDPLVLPLPVGSSFRLGCALDQYVDEATGSPLALAEGSYQLAAQFTGAAVTPQLANADSQGLAL